MTEEVTPSKPKLSQFEQDRIRREGERIAEEHRAKEAAKTTAPEKAAPPKTVAQEDPKRALRSVAVEVFMSSRRPEHRAGFVAYARAEKLVRRTIPEWEQAWEKFMNTPIKC